MTFYYESPNIKVSNSIYYLNGDQYHIKQISTIRVREVPQSKSGPISLAIFSGIMTLGGVFVFVFGVAGGIYWAYKIKPKYHLIIELSGSPGVIYESNDLKEIEDIRSAINKAMESFHNENKTQGKIVA